MMTDSKREINQLPDDHSAVMSDVEEILKAITDRTGEEIIALRARTEDDLRQVRHKQGDMGSGVLNHAMADVRATDHLIYGNPWRSILIASGVGLLSGLLSGRR